MRGIHLEKKYRKIKYIINIKANLRKTYPEYVDNGSYKKLYMQI